VKRPLLDSMHVNPESARPAGLLQRLAQILFSRPVRWARLDAMLDDGSPFWRVCRGILYRLALLPMLAMLIAAAIVYVRTHPQQPPFVPDPLAVGVYYEPVNMLTEDGKRLEGWLIPALNAQDVLTMHEGALHLRSPAVVLVNDFGHTRQQILPLIRPLHERGWIVLAIGLRGNGTASPSGQTLGLNESLDVKAAVELLRRSRFVDGAKIAVVGIGSGANATLIAADRDAALTALVLDDPAETGDQAISTHLLNHSAYLAWLNPLCKLAFEIGYGLDVRDLDMEHYQTTLAARPTLLLRADDETDVEVSPQRVNQIVDFLSYSLPVTQQQADDGD
jgi:pimeloyl-ACP methyl ester carboxylesterase